MTALRDICIAFLSALAVRVVVIHLLPKSWGSRRIGVAYGALIALVLACFAVVSFSAMPLYGFDAANPRHVAGYWAMWIGVLLAIGTPMVAVVDGVTSLLKRRLKT